MRRQLVSILVGVFVVAYGSLVLMIATSTEPALGLDLQGGISVTQRAVSGATCEDESLQLAVEKIRERVDALGVAEPEILCQGDTVVVNLPGVKNQRQAEELVQVTGQLYLRPLVGECVDAAPSEPPTSEPSSSDPADTTAPPTSGPADSTVPPTSGSPGPSRAISSTNTTTPMVISPAPATTDAAPTDSTTPDSTTPDTTGPDTTAVTETTEPAPVDENGIPIQQSDPFNQQYLRLKGTTFYCPVGPAWNPEADSVIEGTGEVFTDTATAAVLTSGWGVQVDLREGSEGRDIWNAIASACYSYAAQCPTGQLGIELDGEIQSNPAMREPSFSAGVEISGDFTETEARNLARVLNSGSLPVQMQLESVQNVSPTLGEDSLRAAVISGLVGVGLVLTFMVAYYRFLGLIVAVGLTVSGALLYSVVSLLSRSQGLALSLSGIAGIIVAVGVTVDSYVVFFERLKDEVKSGKSMRNSAQRGFTGAWRAIVIADLVSLIGAMVLWYLTVGAVRGFAFFLGLSTAIDLLVAYFFTRPTVLLLSRTRWMSQHKVMGVTVAANGGAA